MNRFNRASAICFFSFILLSVQFISCGNTQDASSEKSGYVTGADGAELFYRITGSGTDTLVILHGGPGAGMHSFMPSIEPLGSEFVLLFFDQRGGGRSTLPSDTTMLQPEHFVEDLEAVRVHFGLDRMKVVTHSFGSILLAAYAERYPDRLDRVVLHGATGPLRSEMARYYRALAEQDHPEHPLDEKASALLQSLLQGTADDPAATCREYEEVSRQILEDRGETVHHRGTTCQAPSEAVGYYYRYTARLAPRYFGPWDFTGRLDSLKAPVLVMYGARDTLAIPSQRRWTRVIPDSRLCLVPEAGKAALSDNPAMALTALETFMEGYWPRSAESPQD